MKQTNFLILIVSSLTSNKLRKILLQLLCHFVFYEVVCIWRFSMHNYVRLELCLLTTVKQTILISIVLNDTRLFVMLA